MNALILQNILLKERILIRNCANFEGLDETYVRIAVKDKTSIAALKRGLNAQH